MNKVPVSVVIITLNAERLLEKVLSAVKWADEIVLVDSGSEDNTLKIAKAHGAKIFYQPFDGFGKQKQTGVNAAKWDWILSIDADEIPDQVLQKSICSVVNEKPTFNAFKINRTLVFMGRKLRFSGENQKPILRLFNRNFASFSQERVHERIITKGPTGVVKGELLHYSYFSLEEMLDKSNRYTSISIPEIRNKWKKSYLFKIFISFPLKFFGIYIFKLGILDGVPGFLWAFYSGVASVTKYAKPYESLK